ncbi:M23 family metallopeptidase [Brevibacillus sp. SYP-B805]|uniref:M23 family metallopeptidase n=1 Tax=Brevibacillus sp. SYP-B805 TaxID=1578199 RepID=UPI0013ED2281|nr:M23 family metallopeptidase [Brevibacillus sp. SYP-B805]NGQ94993.1 M23 family metallopeptidase [Brevibacillus sp. SYP-B805]
MNPFEAYRVTSTYGPRISPITGKTEKHTGIDLVKRTGGKNAPIEAFVSGTVIRAEEVPEGVRGTGYGGFGLVVAIKDKYGVQHMYAHLSKAHVKVGDCVKAGQVIGLQGRTGKSTGEHLHYEVRLKCSPSGGFGSDTEPTKYLQDYFSKEEEEDMKPFLCTEKANQYIAWLKEEYYEEPEEKRKMIGEIADILRIASGQPPQNTK